MTFLKEQQQSGEDKSWRHLWNHSHLSSSSLRAALRGGKGLGWCQKVGERGMEEGKAKQIPSRRVPNTASTAAFHSSMCAQMRLRAR